MTLIKSLRKWICFYQILTRGLLEYSVEEEVSENEKLYINFSIDSFVCDWICHHEKYRQFYRKWRI